MSKKASVDVKLRKKKSMLVKKSKNGSLSSALLLEVIQLKIRKPDA